MYLKNLQVYVYVCVCLCMCMCKADKTTKKLKTKNIENFINLCHRLWKDVFVNIIISVGVLFMTVKKKKKEKVVQQSITNRVNQLSTKDVMN